MSSKATIFFGAFTYFILCFPAYAQQETNQTIDWYESFFAEKDKETAEKELNRDSLLLEEAFVINDHQAKSRILKEMGLLHLIHTHDYDVAMDCFVKALSIEDSLRLEENKVFTYLAIAEVFEVVGDHRKSDASLSVAERINEQFKNIPTLTYILNKQGKINASIGKIDVAFEKYDHVLKYADVINPKVEAEALFNQAHLHTLRGKYDDALETHKQALEVRRSIRDKKNEAYSLNYIGELYRLMRNDEKAFANHLVALEIRQTLNDKKGLAQSFNNIGILYYQQKNFERSVANLQLALAAAQDVEDQEEMKKSYDYLSLCFKEVGDFKRALENRDRYSEINDFIQRERNELYLVEIKNRYDIDKIEIQVEKLEAIRLQREKEIEAQKQFRNFLVALIVLGVVVLVLIFILYLVKQRSNKVLKAAHAKVREQNLELKDLNATKDKFFSIISHDLKGPLNSLTSFSSLLINHTDSLSKDEIRMLAKDLDKSLKNLFALLENLLEWSRSQTGNIEFKAEPFDLSALLEQNKLLLQTQAQNKNITIDNLAEGVLEIGAHKHSINTVIRNLISNAIKFTPAGGRITLGMKTDPNKVNVFVKDTGVGMSAEVIDKLFRLDAKHSTKGTADEKGTGLGLILCKEFVQKNGGIIWVESEAGKGSVFYFSLPLTASTNKHFEFESAGHAKI